MSERPRLGFVGAGKVGSTLARLLSDAGYPVTAIFSRDAHKASVLAGETHAIVVASVNDVLLASDLVFLTVPDDALATISNAVTESSLLGKGVVHTSGARNRMVLEPLAQAGAMTGSLHPAYPFADVDRSVKELPGSVFVIEAADELMRSWLRDVVMALRGIAVEVSSDQKTLYHAALVIASNYAVTLYAIAERMLIDLGMDKARAEQTLNPLVMATAQNLVRQGIPAALTGPLARGDAGTVAAHLAALSDPALAHLYSALARLTLPMVMERGIDTTELERMLIREEKTSCA